MTRKHSPLLAISVATLLLGGCTLQPIGRPAGHDLLDDTPEKPPVVYKASDAARTSFDKGTVLVAKPVEKNPEMPVQNAAAKPAAKPEVKAPPAPVVGKETPPSPPKPTEPPKAPPVKEAVAKEAQKIPAPPKLEPIVTCGASPKAGEVPPPRPPVESVKRNTLKSGDRLKITVYRESELSGNYQVNDKGMITFPLLGSVTAAGSTASQLEEKLVNGLKAGYLVAPQVTVEQLPDCVSK